MEYLRYLIIGIIVLNIIGNILLIWKDRKQKTHIEAVADWIYMSIIIYFLIF